MKVLMISLDKSLLELKIGGDALERHQAYGRFLERLEIIVFSPKGYQPSQLSQNVFSYPTNSKSRWHYFWDAYQLGEKIYQANDYDLIVCQDLASFSGYLLKRKLKIPWLINCHGDFLANPYWRQENWFNFLLEPLIKFSLKKADGIRVVSQGIKEKVIKLGVRPEKIRVISTPVNLEKFEQFNPVEIAKIKNQYLNKKIVLFVGRLVKAKDLPTLLKAVREVIKEYSQVVFLIIGGGPEEENFQFQVSSYQLPNYVKILGQIKHNYLVNYYRAADLLVLPSTNESFGKVVLEAAMARKPTVRTKTAGAGETIIDGKTGFIVPIKDAYQMAKKILELLKNEPLTQTMGQAAYEYIKQKFDYQKNIDRMIKFWQDLM